MDKDLNGQNEDTKEEGVTGAAESEASDNAAKEQAREEKNGESKPVKERKPLEKKTLIRIISIAAAAVVAAVALTLGLVFGLKGCGDGGAEYTVALAACDHVSYVYTPAGEEEAVSKASAEVKVKKGATFTFSLSVEDGYTQLPTVKANGVKLNPAEGVYSLVVNSDVAVEVTDVVEVSYSLDGSGTEGAPYILKSVKDLDYLARVINEGNVNFVQAYYKLGADIDCGGAKLSVIGDGSTVNSFFGGFFEGDNRTVSNFVIETDGIEYAGFFGFVQASTSGGVLGTVQNFNLKDFKITAVAAPGKNVSVGSIMGHGIASVTKNCSAVNGSVNVFGNNYFCYAGGAIGIQQSAVIASASGITPFYSITENVRTDVDIFAGAGYTIAAGGITGMLYSDAETAPSVITNCYAEGGVYGAMRAGGVVGFLNNYSSVNNVYSTGEISARSEMRNLNDEFAGEYGAYAGGLVGYAGYNTLIANSFTLSKTEAAAKSANATAAAGDVAGYLAPAGVATYAPVIFNVYSGDAAQGASASFIKNVLKWNAAQWSAADGSLPSLTGAAAASVNVTLDFGGKTVGGAASVTASASPVSGHFAPICAAYVTNEKLPDSVTASDGFISYGYYFDAELKSRVPYGFVAAGDVTLYAAFADYGEVAGNYYYNNRNGRNVALKLYDDGTYLYEDGITYASYYEYDGETVYFYDGIFARLSSVVTGDGIAANFDAYRFAGKKTAAGLTLYDGVYFTADEPLALGVTAAVAENDGFKGEWEKSSTLKETYAFDGEGSWTYSYGAVNKNGVYAVSDGVATLTLAGGGAYGVAEIDNSGLISVKLDGETAGTLYCLKDSMFGIWFDSDSGNYVRFEGYGQSLAGSVIASLDGTPYDLNYVRDGYAAGSADGVCFTILNDSAYFGSLVYINENKTLTGELYSVATGGFVRHTFYLVDNYVGEWIGEGALGGITFSIVNFNGFGTYEVDNGFGLAEKLGYIEINGERVPYTADVNDGLKGEFTYKNVSFTLSYNEVEQKVTISGETGGEATLERKDAIYAYKFIDPDNNVYSFNGGGYLSAGGVLTVTDNNGGVKAVYGYKASRGGNLFPDKNIEITLTDANDPGQVVGSMRVNKNINKMVFTVGSLTENLDLYTQFTGVWAISGRRGNFSVSNFDLSLTARGGFRDMPNATYTLDYDNNFISVTYMTSESLTAYTMYILCLEDGNLAVTSQPYLVAGDYFYASRQDEVYGSWSNSLDSSRTLEFDGLADSRYEFGIAYDWGTGVTYNYTRRFGKIYMWLVTDDSEVFVLNTVDYQATGENIFVGTTRVAYEMVAFDELSVPVCTAKDGETEYKFFFDGSLERDGRSGSYELEVMRGNVTRLVMHFAGEDDVTAEVNHVDGTVKVI